MISSTASTVRTLTPVLAPWPEEEGPLLSLGMLTAAARSWREGLLEAHYRIQPPRGLNEIRADDSWHVGPGVLLCSDYVWNLDRNLEFAREAKSINPSLLVIHGGPSSPKYVDDARRFLREHASAADILVRGEGEEVLCQLLHALVGRIPDFETTILEQVPGLTFLDPESESVIRTRDQPRIAALDQLPSPYLTGEFDHIPTDAWVGAATLESNRGCPYGCTYCDWGSSTMSRIRKFGIERVVAEFAWCAERQIAVNFADANFGILPRDVEIAQCISEIRRTTGSSEWLSFTPAKNTMKHLSKIFDHCLDAGFVVSAAISLQTVNESILKAVDRSNIATDSYLSLAADLRRRGVPLQGDLLAGLPLQTYQSYLDDVQFMVDHEISARTWSLSVLPNAPINAPDQRVRFRIETDGAGVLIRNSTMGPADTDRIRRFRNVYILAEHLGMIRHVLRYLQWDHGLRSVEVMDRLLTNCEEQPDRYPTVSTVVSDFVGSPLPEQTWKLFYDEIRELIVHDLGIARDSGLDCVLDLQQFLMPSPSRNFPETIELSHDYLGYYRSATGELYRTGRAGVPSAPLGEWHTARFTVVADPLNIGEHGMNIRDHSTNEQMLGDMFGPQAAFELASPLTRVLPRTRDFAIEAGAVRASQDHLST